MAQEDSHRRRRDVSTDRMSSLPEPILCHILSFLPTKDAVKTTLLSPRFLNLWKHIKTLRFYFRACTNVRKRRRFVHFVNRVFLVLETKCIDKFSIELSGFGQRGVLRDSLSNWVAAAVARNVKNLEVFVNGSSTYKPWFELPTFVFTCKSLEILQLRNVVVMLNRGTLVCLPNLRILRFEEFSLKGEECIDKIVSGCSSLHTLYLRRVESRNTVSFSVCSRTLEHLTIISSDRHSSSRVCNRDRGRYMSSSDSDSDTSSISSDRDTSSSDNEEDEENGASFGRIKIDAPALKYLHLKQTMLKELSIKTLSPLIEAVVLPGDAKCDQDTCDNLILALSGVKILGLDFSDVWLEASAPSRLFPNLTGLTMWNFSGQFYFLKELLRKSPTLETLHLLCINSSCSNRFGEPNLMPGYRSPSLKMVKVDNFYGTTNQLKLLEYILLNASLLETLKITTSTLNSRRKLELLQEISNLRRKSTRCRIKFD